MSGSGAGVSARGAVELEDIAWSDARCDTIGVTVSGTLTSVIVEVADAGGVMVPRVRPGEDLDAEGGRGLRLVAALAGGWGFRENAAGRVAWFTISGAAGRTG